MDIVLLIGRILFGGYFIISGINHFRHRLPMTEYARSKNVPSPMFSVLASGVLLLLGGLGILLGAYVNVALLLLVIFLIPTTFIMHNFWKEEDLATKMRDKQHFMKNMALLGGVLMLYALYISNWGFALNLVF